MHVKLCPGSVITQIQIRLDDLVTHKRFELLFMYIVIFLRKFGFRRGKSFGFRF